MKKSKKLVFFGTILSLAVVGYSSKIVFFGGKTLNFREEPIDPIEVVIVGTNEYGATLEASIKGKVSDLNDYTYQWWYLDYSGKDTKRKTIAGENNSTYLITEKMKDRAIGVSVYDKNNKEYNDVTDRQTNSSDIVVLKNIEVTLEGKESTYSGNVIYANTANVSDGSSVNYTYYTDSKCSIKTTIETGASYEGDAPIDAGEYYVQARLDDVGGVLNPNSRCVSHVIKPVKVNVNWSSDNFIYNGSKQGNVASSNTYVNGEVVNLSNDLATNVGIYKTTAYCNSVSGGRGKCSNYELSNTIREFSIDKADTTVSLNESVNTYNGLISSANKAVSSVDGEIKYTYYLDNACTKLTDESVGAGVLGSAPIDAGNYYVKAELMETGNYKGSNSGCVSHKILPKDVNVIWNNTNLYFTGEEQGPEAKASGTIDKEVVILSRPTEFDKGTYDITATCRNVLGGRGKCSNYNLVNNRVTYTINKKVTELELFSLNYTYDGENKSISGKTNSDGQIVFEYYKDSNLTIKTDSSDGAITLGGAPADAGIYYVRATVLETEDYVSLSKVVTLTIEAKEVEFSWDNQNYDYNGSYIVPVFGSVNGVDTEKINLVSLNGATDVGKYNTDVVCSNVENGRGECSNYKLLNNSGNFKINKVKPVINVKSFNKTYNAVYDPVVSTYTFVGGEANVESNIKFYYDKTCSKEAKVEPVDVGKYYFRIETKANKNFKDNSSECLPYTITKKEVSINWEGSKYIYNGKGQGPKATVNTGLNENIILDVKKEVNAGTYITEATCKKVVEGRNICDNYSLINNSYSFKIEKKSPIIEVTDTFNMTYPSEDRYVLNYNISDIKNVDLSVNNSEQFTYKYDGEGKLLLIPKEIGIGKINICTVENSNYNSVCKDVAINVNGVSYINENFDNKKTSIKLIDEYDNAKVDDGIYESGRGEDITSKFGVKIESKTWSTLRFNYGLYNKSGDASIVITISGNDDTSRKILTTSNNLNADFGLTIKPDVTYDLVVEFVSGTKDDYAYLDNVVVTSKKFNNDVVFEQTKLDLGTSIKKLFKKTIESIYDLFNHLIY